MSLKRIETDNLKMEGVFTKQPDKYRCLVNVAVGLSIVYLFANPRSRLWWATEAKLWDLSYTLEIGYGYIVIIKSGVWLIHRAILESGQHHLCFIY